MDDIYSFIGELDKEQADICQILHDYISMFPHMELRFKFDLPFYYGRSWICYVRPHPKGGGVDLSFIYGNELVLNEHLLVSRGRKQVRSLYYESPKEIDFQVLESVLIEAIELDRRA